MKKRITVIEKSETGRNQLFKDNFKKKTMSRPEFVKEIKKGKYHNYHIREINGIETPVSNPDDNPKNNLN
jgi:hypothetical protein